jgi:hypothetical protein
LTNNPEDVKNCTFIDNIKRRSGWGGAGSSLMGEEQVEAFMKYETERIGGNTLYLSSSKPDATSRYAGEAYRCPERMQ